MSAKIQKLLHVLLSFKKILPIGDPPRSEGKITCLQMHVLGFIEKNPKIGMNDIAKFLSITPPSATSLINQLVRAQMLARVPDSTDRRKVLLTLTPKGKKKFETGKAQFTQHLGKIFSVLDEKEMDQFIALMQKVLVSNSVH